MSSSSICRTDARDADTTASLELRALEKMIGARCEQIERSAEEARSRGELDSRECDFQLQVFAERRTKALDQLGNESGEPVETRAARLERLLEALECSREYFCPDSSATSSHDDERRWAICVK